MQIHPILVEVEAGIGEEEEIEVVQSRLEVVNELIRGIVIGEDEGKGRGKVELEDLRVGVQK